MAIQNSDYKSEEIISQSKSNPQNWKNFSLSEFDDPNVKNLVAKVSTDKPILYTPKTNENIKLGKNGKPIRILAVDVGMKYNQIRCFC